MYTTVVQELPDLSKSESIQTVLGIGCITVFAKSLDPHSYQDNGPSPTDQELTLQHRNKVLFAEVMQHIACQGRRRGDEDPYKIFKDVLLHFSKAVLCYSVHPHQPRFMIAETVPTQKLMTFLCFDIRQFQGHDLEIDLESFFKGDLGNQSGDEVLVDHFIPEGIVWEHRQAEVASPDIDICKKRSRD